MPRLNRVGFDKVYWAAGEFVDRALRRIDSLFTPGDQIWSLKTINDLHTRFVLHPDWSKDSFVNKFKRQLDHAPIETIQLAAEVLYVHFLMAQDIGGKAKRKLVFDVLSWSGAPIEIPKELDDVMDCGIAKVGLAYKTYRPFQLWFLIDFGRVWRTRTRDDQQRALIDPWYFREMVYQVPIKSGYAQREALLYLTHPDSFEPMVSRGHKERITRAFAGLASANSKNVDRQLYEIRQKLQSQYGADFSFYDEPIKSVWDTEITPLEKVIYGGTATSSAIAEVLDIDETTDGTEYHEEASRPIAIKRATSDSAAINAALSRLNQLMPAITESLAPEHADIVGDQDRATLGATLRSLAAVFAPPSLGERVVAAYPTPIALAYRRFQDAQFNIYEQVSRLTDLFEATSAFVYHVVLADVLRRLDPVIYFVKDKGARTAYNGYSMATRTDFVSAVLKIATSNGGKDLFTPELRNSQFVERAKRLQAELRNVQAHTGTQSESQQENILRQFQPEVDKMLQDLEFLSRYRLVRIPALFVAAGQWVRRMEIYQGAAPYHHEEANPSDHMPAMIDNSHLVLLNARDEALDLYPLYQLRSSEATRHEIHICSLKQRKKGDRKLEGESIQGAFEIELEGFDDFQTLLQARFGETIENTT